jgi:hypothetical protein
MIFFPGHFIGQSDKFDEAFKFEAMNQQIFFWTSIF